MNAASGGASIASGRTIRQALLSAVLAAIAFGGVAAVCLRLAHQPPSQAIIPWLAGSAVTLVVMLAARLIGMAPRRPLLWLLAGQGVAAVPDLLLAIGVDHHSWMNIFIGHTLLADTPGGAVVWLAVVVVLVAGYAVPSPVPRG